MSGLHIHKNGTPEVIESSDGRLTLSVPIQFKRCAADLDNYYMTLNCSNASPSRPFRWFFF